MAIHDQQTRCPEKPKALSFQSLVSSLHIQDRPILQRHLPMTSLEKYRHLASPVLHRKQSHTEHIYNAYSLTQSQVATMMHSLD